MRCPSCHDEYEDHIRVCAECGLALVSGDAPVPERVVTADAHLGIFHPAMALEVTELLDRRGVSYVVRRHDEGVGIEVDRIWRDDLRAELTMTWRELLGRLDAASVAELSPTGSAAPGWHDAPRGGYVDRIGRLVVEPGEIEDQATDAARVLGPALLTIGAITLIAGWFLIDSPALVVIGVLTALIGLLTPG